MARPKPSRRRSRPLYALYVLALLVASAFAIGAGIAAKQRGAAGENSLQGSWLYDDTRVGRVRMASSAATHLRAGEFEFDTYTDARGLRVRGPGVETPGQVDLLLVGSSFLYGWGLDQPDTLGGMLEAHTGLRVANSAAPAGNAIGAMRAVQELAELRPRWVAYDVVDGNFWWNVCPCVQGTPTPFCVAQDYVAFDRAGSPYLHPAIRSVWAPPEGSRRMFETIFREPRLLPGAYWALRGMLGGLYRRNVQTCSDDSTRTALGLDFALAELLSATRAAGAELIVMYIPDLGGGFVGNSAVRAHLNAGSWEFALLDLTHDVNAHRIEAAGEVLHLAGDHHPNAAGSRLMARSLCLHLQSRAGAGAAPTTCDWPAPAQKSK